MAVLEPIKVKRDAAEQAIMENGKPLSPMARMFHEPDSNIYIIVMLGWKTKLDPEVFKANLNHTLLKHPRFTSLQVVNETVEGGLKWVPTKVDLDKHVIVPKLDTINSIENSDRFVEDYVSNLSKTAIEMSIPMWDLHLLNIRTSDAEAVAVFRIHHSLGDGTSLMSLLLASTRKVSNPEEVPTLPSTTTKRADSSISGGGFRGCLVKIWLLFILLGNTCVDVVMFLATVFGFLKDTETPLKGGRGCGSNSRRIVHRTVDLNDVKFVKTAMNTTINDVLLGVTQAGLSRYLSRKYGESTIDKGASERKNNLPKNIRLRATFFINIRPIPGIQEVADMMKKGSLARWGNEIGFVLFPFKIALRDDPLDYVRDAKAAIDRKKSSLEVYCSFYMAKYFLKFCGMKVLTEL
ncbi:hypothetical protein ACOSQ4_009230 [Xanthoceras sorbifolium]